MVWKERSVSFRVRFTIKSKVYVQILSVSWCLSHITSYISKKWNEIHSYLLLIHTFKVFTQVCEHPVMLTSLVIITQWPTTNSLIEKFASFFYITYIITATATYIQWLIKSKQSAKDDMCKRCNSKAAVKQWCRITIEE